jgi:hypothetical protein
MKVRDTFSLEWAKPRLDASMQLLGCLNAITSLPNCEPFLLAHDRSSTVRFAGAAIDNEGDWRPELFVYRDIR